MIKITKYIWDYIQNIILYYYIFECGTSLVPSIINNQPLIAIGIDTEYGNGSLAAGCQPKFAGFAKRDLSNEGPMQCASPPKNRRNNDR